MVNKSWKEKLTGLVERRANIGMTLTLGDKVMKCIGTKESSYGTRYVFDNGYEFTKSNIVSNIVKCACEGKAWDFKW